MHASIVHSWRGFDGAAKLGVLVKRSYRIEPGGRATALAEEPQVHRQAVQAQALEPAGRPLVHESDLFAFERPLTDVTLHGRAHSTQGEVTELHTAVRVGRAEKRVRVRGDRALRVRRSGELEASEPRPFTDMAFEWTRAYGGRDVHAERMPTGARRANELDELGTFSYVRNRAGRGFRVDAERERLEGLELPNLDDPEDPVEPERLLAADALDWIDRPIAASYGPIDLMTFPRSMFHLLRPDWSDPQRPIRELALGALGERDTGDRSVDQPPDRRICNAAPAGLGVCRLDGDERVTLRNLHRHHDRLEFDLPQHRPRLLLEPPNTKAFELDALLQAILLEPDEDRVTLTWTGSMPVAAVFPEPLCREMNHGALWNE